MILVVAEAIALGGWGSRLCVMTAAVLVWVPARVGMAMIVIVALYNRANPWLSLAFFITAVSSLGAMLRQHRMLPPMRAFE